MVHQHFKLVECFYGAGQHHYGRGADEARLPAEERGAREGAWPSARSTACTSTRTRSIEDITVGMQQRTEILKMLYRDNEILIFDEPTAVLTPQEIDELMQIMKNLAAEGKSILFISHKLAEIMAVADRCTVLRKGKYIGTVNTEEHHDGGAVGHDGGPQRQLPCGKVARRSPARSCWTSST